MNLALTYIVGKLKGIPQLWKKYYQSSELPTITLNTFNSKYEWSTPEIISWIYQHTVYSSVVYTPKEVFEMLLKEFPHLHLKTLNYFQYKLCKNPLVNIQYSIKDKKWTFREK